MLPSRHNETTENISNFPSAPVVLADSGLPDIPFHAGPLLNGRDDHEDIALADLLLSHLDEFQSHETIKIYYDNGQQVVANALKSSIGYALSKETIVYRDAQPKN